MDEKDTEAAQAEAAETKPQPGVDEFAAEAEALGAAIERFARALIGGMPDRAQLAEVHGFQASIRELVGRAAESGAGAQDELALTRAEAEKQRLAAARAKADFLNYQERAQRDLKTAEEQALRGYVADLLPILDSMDFARKDLDRDGADLATAREGLTLIVESFAQALKVRGLECIDVHDCAFDPNLHESVAARPADEARGEKPNMVAEVCRPGYTWKGKLLRPAQVLITAEPKKPS
ncbi:MAG: nucleotide exchange factor GrpE [Planctomycetota bacterium]|nr:nucleotide exchange factor GrpE [Planctomycetota bacterium]